MARDLAVAPRAAPRSPSPDRVLESDPDSENSEDEREEEGGVEGARLYREFLTARLSSAVPLYSRVHPPARPAPFSSELAGLAERFGRTAGREEVRQRAEQADLASLDQEGFTAMLSELFQDGGVTQERILVLFFFCSDLAVRAARAGLRAVLARLTRWSCSFVRTVVAGWVACRGGWERLLQPVVTPGLAQLGLGAAVLGLAAVAVKKHLS